MKKLIAAAISSSALFVAPLALAQSAGAGMGTGGDGGVSRPAMSSPPVTPSQLETSEGAIYNPPPIDHSGNPRHVTDKDDSDGGGDTGQNSVGDMNGEAEGAGESAAGSSGGDAGTGEGTGAGADAGAGAGGAAASGGAAQ